MSNNNTEQAMDIGQFEDLLKRHDWYFDMADDGRYYRMGRESLANIFAILRHHEGTEFGVQARALYEEYAERYKIVF